MKNICILNFHGLGQPHCGVAPAEQPFWVEVSFFEGILDLVRGRRDVQVTFDDSNLSDYEIALPALEMRNMTAKFFVVVARLGQKGFLSPGQVRALAAAGMTIGNHGMNHSRWTGMGAAELHEELVEARTRLEQIVGAPVRDAACPFGSYSRRVLRQLARAGYDKVYTTDECPATVVSAIQPRYSVQRSHDLSQIEGIINRVPRGLGRTWCKMKTLLRGGA